MDWKKIAPWSWFKDEESRTPAARVPVRVAPGDSFTALRSEVERLFDDALQRLPEAPGWLRPSVDISEGKKAYTVRAELPGVDRDDVSLEIEDRRLVIRAEKRQEKEEEDEGWHCVERSYGTVQRVLSLPDDADADATKAKFKNGVLKLRIPKHPERVARGKNIEIESG